MIKALLARIRQGQRTVKFPAAEPVLPDRFRGMPSIDSARCKGGCRACVDACPTGAVAVSGGKLSIDLGRCLFCADCATACPSEAVRFGRGYSLASNSRAALVVSDGEAKMIQALDAKMLRLFGRSLKLRQVSAGGCGACEADINSLSTVVFDLGRFGIQVVASPRHADGLLVTGPVTANMRLALEKTYAALPAPKIVIACGACAISGGPYIGHREAADGVERVLPVDLYIPGCPPHPIIILDGLLGMLGRLDMGGKGRRAAR